MKNVCNKLRVIQKHVKSRSNPFLELTSTKHMRVKFLPQGNNSSL